MIKQYTDRFIKDLQSHPKPIRIRIKSMVDEVMLNPIKGLSDPHELKQFSTDEFEVWSRDITHWDRLVYEIHKDKIVFTNCKNHQYRGKRYSQV